jgi:hypothetical protein
MGNSAWGHGYHKGFGDGAKQGGTIVGIVLLGVGGLVEAGKWGYRKLKDRKLAKADDIASEMDEPGAGGVTDPQGSN